MSRHHLRLNKRQWARVRRAALDRDNWRCCHCGRLGRLEVDHVRRIEDGGELYELRNLQTLCRDCHRRKTAGENELPNPERAAWREFMHKMI